MLGFIDIPFEYASSAIGASADEVKLIFSFLLSYPLAGLLKRIPDKQPWQKNVFIVGVSLFYLLGLFDLWGGLVTITISASGAYLIAKYVDGPFMPWISFVFLMGHMSLSHIQRQAIDAPSSVDISGAQMVMVMKLTAFCWNIHDGRLKQEDLSEFQRQRALPHLPHILNYAGYVLFFPSFFAGPAFDYVEYSNYITTTMFDLPPGIDPAKAPPTRKKRRIPRSGTPATWKAVTGLAWIFAFIIFSGWYNPETVLGEDFMTHNFFRRIFILHMFGVTTRMKYYGVWHMTEGACILSGIGYNGVDPKTGRANWDRLQNVRPWDIESAQNARAFLGNWNINTNNWLRNYMYLRVTPKGKKPGFQATLATFFTSAFWHGFFPGYYLAFVLAAFLQTIAKRTRRLVRPLFMQPAPNTTTPTSNKRYYDLATWVITQAAFSFTVAPFVVLSLTDSLIVWSRVYFYCIIGVVASFGFLLSPFAKRLSKQVDARTRGVAVSTPPADGTRPALDRNLSYDREPILGMPDDPEKEVNEIVRQVRLEMERRSKEEGMKVPDVSEVRREVESKLKSR